MASEYTDVVAAFLIQRLTGDSTLNALVGGRVYDTDLPQADTKAERDALYPCVVFNLQAANPPLETMGGPIVWVPDEYQVMGLDQAKSFTTLVPIAARIRQLVRGFSGQLADDAGYINWCKFLHNIKGSQEVGVGTFKRLGQLYRIAARLSAT